MWKWPPTFGAKKVTAWDVSSSSGFLDSKVPILQTWTYCSYCSLIFLWEQKSLEHVDADWNIQAAQLLRRSMDNKSNSQIAKTTILRALQLLQKIAYYESNATRTMYTVHRKSFIDSNGSKRLFRIRLIIFDSTHSFHLSCKKDILH